MDDFNINNIKVCVSPHNLQSFFFNFALQDGFLASIPPVDQICVNCCDGRCVGMLHHKDVLEMV